MTPREAVNIYESGCMTVVRKFLEIYFQEEDEDLPEYFWVGDKIGDVLNIGDYWLDMENIVDALRLRVPVNTFFAWYDQWTNPSEKAPRYNLEHYTRLQACTHPTKSPAKKDAEEGETNYFICDDCKEPC